MKPSSLPDKLNDTPVGFMSATMEFTCPTSLHPQYMKEFKLTDEYIQLNDLLKVMRLVGTGGEANFRITEGEVRLNGAVELQKRKTRLCEAPAGFGF
jgi:ribosome-associated protein